MNNKIHHGLEIELQLMAEIDGELKVVSAEHYLDRQYNLLPQCVTFDYGNLEILTPPRESYKEAVEIANHILDEKLIPALINDFKLEKFALFLPTPMCKFYYNEEPIYKIINRRRIYVGSKISIISPSERACCLKHWNISLNIDEKTYKKELNALITQSNYSYNMLCKLLTKYWPYNYELLINKGYDVLLKDLEIPYAGRVHIKIPYHYAPTNSNPDLLPNFEDIIIPPERGWRNLVCYYKNGIYTKVRNLI